jgi:DNA-binding beta-propeller fold protein YncE
MKRIASLFLLVVVGTAQAQGPQPLWKTDGFANPESVIYSSLQKVLYVSNSNGAPDAKDGNGFISQVGMDGKVIQRQWVKGLNAPKGLGYIRGYLYVADIDQLLEIDTGNKRITRRFKAEGAKFLNDVTVTPRGTVFVSDMFTNTIWRLQGDSFTPWLKDDALEAPNGLLFENGQLLVASWGAGIKPDFATDTPGYIKAVDVETKAITARFSPIPLGNLDGLVADGKGGYVVSDWMRGNVFKIGKDGQPNLWLQLTQGTADVGTAPGLLLLPQMVDGTVSAYSLK